MKTSNICVTTIHVVLKSLIEAKSRRDNIKFTSYQLASALSMPRSIITKLTHTDETKRIINPKIETLIKIVDFFRTDGFDITIDDLLGIGNRSIAVQSQELFSSEVTKPVLLYSMNNVEKKVGIIDVKFSNPPPKNVLGLYSEENIDPFFKAGSIFVVDLDKQPSHDMLIAVKLNSSEKIQIKKYCLEKNKVILKSFNHKDKDILLMPTHSCKILGVIIHINAKT